MTVWKSPVLVAIVGGSGSGKTWLADELARRIGSEVGRISLDDFYWDRSDLSPGDRAALNFDHPEAIEWPLFEHAMIGCAAGDPVAIPRYDFETHSRLVDCEPVEVHPIVFVDGLWLLYYPSISRIFHLTVYLECPQAVRLQRRVDRDVACRGREPARSMQVFNETVVPMHNCYVAPQKRQADEVLNYPLTEADIDRLCQTVMKMDEPPTARRARNLTTMEQL